MMGAVNSETLLGDFIKERKKTDSVEVAVATKFAALPWRIGRGSVVSALKASLSRLGLSSVDLYQLHWPGFWGNEEKQLRDAYDQLKRGIPFAANQVQYSLIYRNPEENGVKAAFDELGITLIACSPMAQGILTGKYTPERPPTGPRSKAYTPEYLTKEGLNRLTCHENVLPIPGAKNAEQAKNLSSLLDGVSQIKKLRSSESQITGITDTSCY